LYKVVSLRRTNSLCCYCSLSGVDMLGFLWSYVYYVFLRRMLKWCLRKWTGKCELQRITDTQYSAAASCVFDIGQYFITYLFSAIFAS